MPQMPNLLPDMFRLEDDLTREEIISEINSRNWTTAFLLACQGGETLTPEQLISEANSRNWSPRFRAACRAAGKTPYQFILTVIAD
jgi:hypothetical protein